MKLHFLKPMTTVCEWRKQAWGGEPPRYKVTQPAPRKQWLRVQRMKRKAV